MRWAHIELIDFDINDQILEPPKQRKSDCRGGTHVPNFVTELSERSMRSVQLRYWTKVASIGEMLDMAVDTFVGTEVLHDASLN